MRRKTIAILITVAMILGLIGCGKKESDVIAEGKINISTLSMEEDALDEIPEEQIVTFECMNEIKEASPESGLIQIYDMLFQYGCKVSEAIEIIENSQNKFEYYHDYNENELILPGDYSEQIIFTNHDEWAFQFVAQNICDETIPLKECIVTMIQSEKNAKGNVFLGGYDGCEPFTYDYVKNMFMKDYEVNEYTSYQGSDTRHIVMQYCIASNIIEETDELWLTFVIESETGEVIKISIDKRKMNF